MPIISKALISSFIEKYLACFDDKNAGIVFALSFLFTTIWFTTAPVIFTADSDSYLAAARAMLGMPGGYFLYFRSEGYPLILNLSGVTLFDTFIGLWLIQFTCAVYIPVLIYKSLKVIDARTAYCAALLSIISTIPYLYSKAVMTQQIYLFLQVLIIYYFVKCLSGLKDKYLIYLTLTFILLCAIRPSGSLVFYITMILIIYFRLIIHERKLSYIINPAISILFFLSAQQIINRYHENIADPIMQYSVTSETTGKDSSYSTTGKSLFFNPYVAGKIYSENGLVKAENGPATARLISILHNFIKTSPQVTANFLDDLAHNPSDDQITKRFIIESDGKSHYAWWAFSDAAVGIGNADKLFFKATVETLTNNPVFLLHYLRNFCLIIIGIEQNIHYGNVKFNIPSPFIEQQINSKSLTRKLKNEIKENAVSNNHLFAYKVWSFYFTAIKAVILLLALVFIVGQIKNRSTTPFYIFVSFLCLIEYIVISIFASPIMHYMVFGVLPLIILAAPTISKKMVVPLLKR